MDNIKQRILSYSVEALQSSGIKSLTLKNICQGCHISRSTFYLYFKSKSALIEEIKETNCECDIPSTRENILLAAAEAFSRGIYADVDIETVAKAVNMKRSSVYRYFPTKDKLFEECLKMELENRREFFRSKDVCSMDFKAAISVFFSYILDFRSNEFKNLTFFHALAYSQHNASVKSSLEALWNDTEEIIRKVLRHGKETGELRTDFSVEKYSRIILAFMGGSSIFASDSFSSAQDTFIDMIFNELKAL